MATEIKMPQLSDTMLSGKILSWKKKEGEEVHHGDILAEVETEKANLEIESFSQGVLLKIFVAEGESAQVGDTIAVVGQAGESVSIGAPSPNASLAAVEPLESPSITSSTVAAQLAQHITDQNVSSERVKVSPLARRMAQERQIDLSKVIGSGPSGRIVRKDIEAAFPSSGQAYQSSQDGSQTLSGSLHDMSKMRGLIATRMQQSFTESPHFYITVAINMGEAIKLHASLKENPDFDGVSITHIILKACAYALRKEPGVNCSIRNGQIFEPQNINIGIVTAVDDGLLIPVIRDVDALPLREVVFETRAAVERAKAGRPNSTDLSGGTFSISNMGMFDVENFTAIINPGQGAILAVSSIKEEAIVSNGQIGVGQIMRVTLSADHQVIDGVCAAKFLKHFKEALEHPAIVFVS